MGRNAKCPYCGSTNTRRYVLNGLLSFTGQAVGNIVGDSLGAAAKSFLRINIGGHLGYTLGSGAEWLSNECFSKLVCADCHKTFPKPKWYDKENPIG